MPFQLNNKYGCYANKTHGHASNNKLTPTYLSWRNMLQRMRSKDPHRAKYYSGRGIRVCARWMSFENFLADMGERPEAKFLDRINNDGNYELANCKWSTRSEQARNRRKMMRKLKTHCSRGHLFDTRTSRQQVCSICAKIRMEKWKLRHQNQ